SSPSLFWSSAPSTRSRANWKSCAKTRSRWTRSRRTSDTLLTIGDAIDKAAAVVADVERAIRPDSYPHRPPVHPPGAQPAGGEHLSRATGHAAIERHAEHLVADRLRPVPRAVQGDEQVATIRVWEGVAAIEGQP